MRARLLIPICLALAIAQSVAAQAPAVDARVTAGDPGAAEVVAMAGDGKATVEAFFGKPFPEPIHLTVAPDRVAFPANWGTGQTESWMVGTGVADFLVVLSPADWAKEACDHDAGHRDEVRGVIVHELVHVYHGQFNPTRDFTGMDDVGWFVEGLAVVVSGQLSHDRLSAAAAAVRAGTAPTTPATLWSGPQKYGLAGSMVAYVDATYGRQTVIDLLPMTKQDEILARLDVTEAQLLDKWRAWLLAQA